MNISSIVVQTRAEYLEQVIIDLKNSGVCDYHMHDDIGRVIVTIEGEGVSEELKKLKVIETIPHIVSADMQMAYSEDELNSHMDILENADAVPHMLYDDDLKPEDIIYNGDLKKKDLQSFTKQFDQTIIKY